jgi:hypothetical protein
MSCEINYDNPKHRRFILNLKKQGALEELEKLERIIFDLENGKVGELINNPKFDYKYYIHERIKELKEGVEK